MKSNTATMEAPETVVAVLPKNGAASPREVELGSEVSKIEAMAEAVSINSDQDYESAGQFGVMLKQKAAEVTEFFKPLKDSAYKTHRAICDREKEMLTPLRNAEKTLKKTMGDYALEKERKRREAEERRRKAESSRKSSGTSKSASKSSASKKSSSSSSSVKFEEADDTDFKLSNDFRENRGRLPVPISGAYAITSRYGTYNVPGLRGVRLENKGINLTGHRGAEARSIFTGEVVTVANFGGSYTVIVRHGNYYSVYNNLASVSVRRGQRVKTAQHLGRVATDATGNCVLHFQLRYKTSTLNPQSWLK